MTRTAPTGSASIRRLASILLVLAAAGFAPALAATEPCRVIDDPAGDVAGPLGTPRPTAIAGATVDLLGVSLAVRRDAIIATVAVRDLGAQATAGTDGAFYTVFWSLGHARYFAQATRVGPGWTFSAGRAAGLDDTVPQQGPPADGVVSIGRDEVRIYAPRAIVGAPAGGALLHRVRAASQESIRRAPGVVDGQPQQPAVMSDAAGGPEGGRFLIGGGCLPGLTAAGERCIVALDAATDATGGRLPYAFDGTALEADTRRLPVGPVDPATEIVSLQLGSNVSTLIVEVAVAGLAAPIPDGADGERWDVSWRNGDRVDGAFAERRASGAVFGYRTGDRATPTTGIVDRASGTVRILVPLHEIGAASTARLTSVAAVASLVVGGVADVRDTAPDQTVFAAQYVTGVSCAAQQQAACPVVLDVLGDAGPAADQEGNAVPEEQPASDLSAAGAAAPDGSLVLTARLRDLGAPPPDGFDLQGWTISFTWQGVRYYGQAERSATSTVFRYGAYGPASQSAAPTGPGFGRNRAEGAIDPQTGIVRIAVPREAIGATADGAVLADLGAVSWVMKTGEVSDGVYAPTAPYLLIDQSPVAPYAIGLACGA